MYCCDAWLRTRGSVWCCQLRMSAWPQVTMLSCCIHPAPAHNCFLPNCGSSTSKNLPLPRVVYLSGMPPFLYDCPLTPVVHASLDGLALHVLVLGRNSSLDPLYVVFVILGIWGHREAGKFNIPRFIQFMIFWQAMPPHCFIYANASARKWEPQKSRE